MSGMNFYWIKSENRVVYATADTHEISFPDNLKSQKYSTSKSWYSLNGDIELEDYQVSGNSATVSTGGQFAKFANEFASDSTITNLTISEDIDLAGGSYKFGGTASENTVDSLGKAGINKSLTISGGESTNRKTIYGFRDDTNNSLGAGDYATKGYGYGLFGSIVGESTTVKLENIVLDGFTIGETTDGKDNGTAAVVCGYLGEGATLELSNVTFKNCTVIGYQKIAMITGQTCGTVKLTDVTFENCTVEASCEGVKLCSYINGKGSVNNTSSSTNVTTSVSGISMKENSENPFVSYATTAWLDSNSKSFSKVTTSDGTFNGLFYYCNKKNWHNSDATKKSVDFAYTDANYSYVSAVTNDDNTCKHKFTDDGTDYYLRWALTNSNLSLSA